MDPFIGQIQAFGFNFAPRDWALCNGQLLPISSNSALFSLLGTAFGGDGRINFALPDLRGRSIVGVGEGKELSSIKWGERGGSENFNILPSQLPAHSHTQQIPVNNDQEANLDDPTNHVIGISGSNNFYATPTANQFLLQSQTSYTGGGQAIQKRSPYLGVYVCIALFGIFPSRS